MDELRFDSAFMFAYSERDLTYAARKMPDDVPEETKQRRLAEIIALQERITAEIFAAQVGRRERVLVEHGVEALAAELMGRTDGFKTVILPAPGVGAGRAGRRRRSCARRWRRCSGPWTESFNRDVIGYALRVEAYALLIHDRFPSFDVFSAAEKPALAWRPPSSARRA